MFLSKRLEEAPAVEFVNLIVAFLQFGAILGWNPWSVPINMACRPLPRCKELRQAIGGKWMVFEWWQLVMYGALKAECARLIGEVHFIAFFVFLAGGNFTITVARRFPKRLASAWLDMKMSKPS
jgi:hypothetical protein